MERTYIITYYYPFSYQGTYVTKAKDSIDAENKLHIYLANKYGHINDCHSIILEVYDNQLIYV